MALLLPKYNAIFFHVPKTGGMFIDKYLRSRTKVQWIGYKHSPIDLIGPIAYRKSFKFCFIRNPVDWYKSYFSMRKGKWDYWEKQNLWHPTWEIDPNCSSDNIEVFINQCLNLQGFLNRLYQRYIGTGYLKVNFIGKTENLASDLSEALNFIGCDHNPEYLKNLPKVNTSKQAVEVPEYLEQRIKEVENFYYEN